jgi:hypothetical protein
MHVFKNDLCDELRGRYTALILLREGAGERKPFYTF